MALQSLERKYAEQIKRQGGRVVSPRGGAKRPRLYRPINPPQGGRRLVLREACIHCGVSFTSVGRFIAKRSGRSDYVTNQCIVCHQGDSRTNNQQRKRRWANFKRLWVGKHGGGKCPLCGYADLSCMRVFDFHHKIPGEKKYSIPLTQGGYLLSNQKLFVMEARKCIVVCANCHRKIHEESYD